MCRPEMIEAKITGELRLLDEAESFGGIGDSSHVGEALLQRRHARKRLEGIVVNK